MFCTIKHLSPHFRSAQTCFSFVHVALGSCRGVELDLRLAGFPYESRYSGH